MIDHGQIEYVRIYGSAAAIEIGNRVVAGEPFDKAKSDVAKKIMKGQACPPETRKYLWNMICSIEPIDMPKKARRHVQDMVLAEIEKMRGKKAGIIERFYFRLTGNVFWV
jgi:CTP:phosphocholine cytidylyltransferase-like protein